MNSPHERYKHKRNSAGFFMSDEEISSFIAIEKRDRRNDLAKEAMKRIIQKSPFSADADKTNNWVFDATAAGAYAYADAMLAASGDYDDN
jgi:hypothetical protein